MEDRRLFDLLGNAEDDSMERLYGRCPEIMDTQFDKLLAMSEKKYSVKKREIEANRTEKEKASGDVTGVELGRRPAWITPLCTAASIILVTGLVIGSVTFFRRNSKGGGDIPPVAAVTTTAASTVTTEEITAAANTSETSTTTAATTAEEYVYTTKPYKEPEEVFISEYYGDTAAGLFRKDEEILGASGIIVNGYDTDDRLRFQTDPALGLYLYDIENKGEMLKDTAFYVHITDSRFHSINDLRNYLRTVYSEDNEHIKNFDENVGRAREDFSEDSVLKKIYRYIEYNDKLYQYYSGGVSSCLPRVYKDDEPVLIADATDNSFTAYIHVWYGEINENDPEWGAYCEEVELVLDPEYNEWRIESVTEREPSVYVNLRSKLVYDG